MRGVSSRGRETLIAGGAAVAEASPPAPRRRHQPSPACGCACGPTDRGSGTAPCKRRPPGGAKIRAVPTERVSRSTMPPCRPRASPRQAVPAPNLPDLRCLPRLPSLPDLPAHPRRSHCPLPASAARWARPYRSARSPRKASVSASAQRPRRRPRACRPPSSPNRRGRPLSLTATPSESRPPAAPRRPTACRADTSSEGSMPSSPRGHGPSRRQGDGPPPAWARLAKVRQMQVRRMPRSPPVPVRPRLRPLHSKTSSSPARPRRRRLGLLPLLRQGC